MWCCLLPLQPKKICNPVQHKVPSFRCFFSLLQTCWGVFWVPVVLLYSKLEHNVTCNLKEGILVNYLSKTKLENKRIEIILRSNNRMLCYLAQIYFVFKTLCHTLPRILRVRWKQPNPLASFLSRVLTCDYRDSCQISLPNSSANHKLKQPSLLWFSYRPFICSVYALWLGSPRSEHFLWFL